MILGPTSRYLLADVTGPLAVEDGGLVVPDGPGDRRRRGRGGPRRRPRRRGDGRGMTDWDVREIPGPPAAHHAREISDGTGRALWIFPVERKTLVLGSTQPADIVDHDAVGRVAWTSCAGAPVVARCCWIPTTSRSGPTS
ncbi:MAG: hypothetical protein U5R31_14070 [Acidimicrobiia bacterium]|nr:hypothetical protein [Acidimicrobiia bacterium]